MENIKTYCGIHRSAIPFIILLACMMIGCEKFVEVKSPKSELLGSSVFEEPGSANAVILGLLSNLGQTSNNFNYGIALHTGLYSDEIKNYNTGPSQIALYQNNLSPVVNAQIPLQYWREGYKNIYIANATIEGCTNSKLLGSELKLQLIGEAKFLRALWYFYLVNLFGEVPIITSTEWNTNNVAKRDSVHLVYKQIISDLQDAKMDLKQTFVSADGMSTSLERVRPNRFSASALLARVYLYLEDYPNAEKESSIVISSKSLFDTVAINQVFLKNSKEAIFQISPSTAAANQSTMEARNFILIRVPTTTTLSDKLLSAFEPNDLRRQEWVNKFRSTAGTDYYYPYKYRVREATLATEYSTPLRIAEQYLIRAEANVKLGNIRECKLDLNMIRSRARLKAIDTNDPGELMSSIVNERRLELFCEWGHRWFDLKRYGLADSTLKQIIAVKNSKWVDYKVVWPIPQSEINLNPNLKQNIGY